MQLTQIVSPISLWPRVEYNHEIVYQLERSTENIYRYNFKSGRIELGNQQIHSFLLYFIATPAINLDEIILVQLVPDVPRANWAIF